METKMHPEARRDTSFTDWLKSPDGDACLNTEILRDPVKGIKYLENRLWWAFNAGREAERGAGSASAPQEPK
jgi:hypothetical protein